MFYRIIKHKLLYYPNMSVINQLAINQMRFPVELADIIKSYCFYEIHVAKMISFIKSKKQEIVEAFNNGFSTRRNPFNSYYSISNNMECEWTICLTNYKKLHFIVIEREFKSINCNKCGNYKIGVGLLSERTRCLCLEVETHIDDDSLEIEQQQTYDDYLENHDMYFYDDES